MEVKEKIMPKEDILKLIDDSKIKEVFEAIKTHEGKYNESMYKNLRTDYFYDEIGIDYFDRLRTFINTIGDEKQITENKDEVVDDINLISYTKKLSSAINRVKFFKYNTYILYTVTIVLFFTFLIFYQEQRLDLTIFTSAAFLVLLLSQEVIILFSLKRAENIYQNLVVEVTNVQDLSFFTHDQIKEAKDNLVEFVDLRKYNVSMTSKLYLGLLTFCLGLVPVLYLIENILEKKSKEEYAIKSSLSPKVYIFSPSFDSLLQNDKKVYQYVDSLVEKHKK